MLAAPSCHLLSLYHRSHRSHRCRGCRHCLSFRHFCSTCTSSTSIHHLNVTLHLPCRLLFRRLLFLLLLLLRLLLRVVFERIHSQIRERVHSHQALTVSTTHTPSIKFFQIPFGLNTHEQKNNDTNDDQSVQSNTHGKPIAPSYRTSGTILTSWMRVEDCSCPHD